MSASTCSSKYLIGWLIAGSRGGASRIKIIEALKGTAQNANQLGFKLNMSYKKARYHLDILERNKLIRSVRKTYVTYFLSQNMTENYALFETLLRQMGKDQISCQQTR